MTLGIETRPDDQGATPPRPAAPARPRLAYIDNLRIFLTALVVVHHVAVTYGNIPAWYYIETAKDPSGTILDVLVIFNQTFFMGFFFMISGFFVPGSVDHKGGKGFMRGRLLRLGVPLLLFALLLRPVLTLPMYLADYRDDLPYWLFYFVSWDPGPMWFVEVLLVFSLGYLLVRRWTGKPELPRLPEPVPARGDGRLPGPLAIVGFTVALTLVTFAWRLLVSPEAYWPIVGLPTPAYLPQYLGLFVVGVVAYRRGWFAGIPRSALWWSGAATLVLGFARLTTIGMTGDGAAVRLLQLAAESGFAVSVVLFLLSLFQRFLNRQNATAKFLSDNAFGVYFLHPLTLVVAALALRGWEATAIAKFAVLCLIGVPLSWGAAWLLRRIPGARRIF
ncbi:acyltransferase family protein [Stackebrandtia nassauensis]|uniref:Acyltransferase 3 n=1 Tax=Stackebrandtia nassauensis (strain DSM 44728 / CIP 108903 / NRRL B-16338 / NBRC 102104 / LLR-40K-21) TaxID=446470 RepID=D3PWX8_STANL|nr:acyltransferase family protein [Stackebrandtia nassauensis]ADD45202.1 acyltransferase 3 [Stackebrandtia nassauensis DSM 44728]